MIDTQSATWKFIESELKKELATLIRELEATHLTETETFRIRGQIMMTRNILSMPETIPHNHE